MSSEVGRTITIHIAAEAARVGLAQGFKIPKFNGAEVDKWAGSDKREVWDELDRMLTPASAGGRNWRASMAQDVAKGRPTEIDYMNGHVVAKGKEKGVPTPINTAVVEMVREIDSGARKQSAENIGIVLKRAGV
jgi:2-dehydropantoate 2-reductase